MKLKEFKNWKAVHFSDRTILRKDLKIMSKEQIEALMEKDVIRSRMADHFHVVK